MLSPAWVPAATGAGRSIGVRSDAMTDTEAVNKIEAVHVNKLVVNFKCSS